MVLSSINFYEVARSQRVCFDRVELAEPFSRYSSCILSSYICPALVSLLVISTTLAITLAILHWNYVENTQRKMSKKQTILNHWGKHKPTQADLDKLYLGEVKEGALREK